MKLTAKYLKRVTNESNEVEATFSLPHYQSKWLDELDKSKTYEISIKEKKSDRSIQQNNLYWDIIGEIAKVQGYKDDTELHLQMLEKCGTKTTMIPVIKEAIPMLKEAFRVVKPMYKIKSENDNELIVCKCYFGSSTFNTKEMTELIECALEWASNCGIDIRKYEE